MTVSQAEEALLNVAKKYGHSMTRIAADAHRPKDRAFRMSIARAYLAYERAVKKAKIVPPSTAGVKK